VVTGSYNNKINLYQAQLDEKRLKKLCELPCNGVITDMQFSQDGKKLYVVEG